MAIVNCICETCGQNFDVKWASRKRRFCSKSCAHIGENNPSWKGDNVGVQQVHTWVEKKLGRPDKCSKCNAVGNVDLANISQEYKRDFTDWEWLCRRCHMESDGRLSKFLSHSNMHNLIPEKPCLNCGKEFKPWNNAGLYCSMSCRTTYVNLNKKDYSKYPSPNPKVRKKVFPSIAPEEHKNIPELLLKELK